MIDKKRLGATLLAAIIVSSVAYTDPQQTEDFLSLIGVEDQMASYPQLLGIYIQYNPNLALPLNMGSDQDALAEIINEKIDTTDYFAELISRFDKVYDKERTNFYRKWAETDVGGKITEMEKLASAPEAAYMIMAYGAAISQNPPSERRIELVTQIAKRTGMGQEASELIYEIEAGVEVGLRESLGDVVYIHPATQSSNKDLLDSAVITSALYTYQQATDKELSEYVSVLDHEDMVWCLDHLGASSKDLVYSKAKEIGAASATYFEKTAKEFGDTFDRLDFGHSQIELGRFLVSFPKKPLLQQESIPSADGVIPMTIHYTSFDEIGTAFYASTSTYPPSVVQDKSLYEVLDEVVIGMVGQDKALISQETISKAGIPGYKILLSVYSGMMILRSVILLEDTELTQITFFAPAYIHSHPKVDEFFSSFRSR